MDASSGTDQPESSRVYRRASQDHEKSLPLAQPAIGEQSQRPIVPCENGENSKKHHLPNLALRLLWIDWISSIRLTGFLSPSSSFVAPLSSIYPPDCPQKDRLVAVEYPLFDSHRLFFGFRRPCNHPINYTLVQHVIITWKMTGNIITAGLCGSASHKVCRRFPPDKNSWRMSEALHRHPPICSQTHRIRKNSGHGTV